jgi:hypothetical protein
VTGGRDVVLPAEVGATEVDVELDAKTARVVLATVFETAVVAGMVVVAPPVLGTTVLGTTVLGTTVLGTTVLVVVIGNVVEVVVEVASEVVVLDVEVVEVVVVVWFETSALERSNRSCVAPRIAESSAPKNLDSNVA